MTNNSLTKRLSAAVAVLGMVGVAQLAAPSAANAAPPSDCPAYAVQTTTQTSVSISPDNLSVGQLFTATATVTAAGAPVTGGTVTFSYAGSSTTKTVVAGQASASFTAKRGRIPLLVSFHGQCLAGAAAIGTSSGRYPIVAGVSASTGGGGNGSGNGSGSGNIAGVSGSTGGGSTIGGLAATGMDSQTELYALLGVGMVTVGGLTLVVRRRRIQA